ncbi:MAG: ATP-binding protein [Caldilineaceae bacterium]|nr:ATP-binding protein [Caldilineaceae bacterium]
MHCIQGSDAHRLTADPKNPKRLGIGDRATEFLLDEPTFDALAAVLRSKQFDRVRPARPADRPFDPLDVVRKEGASLVQSFHESVAQRGGKVAAILADICAFANTAGGAVYVGTRAGKVKIKGLVAPGQVEQQIRAGLDERITPPLTIKIDTLQSQNAKVLRIQVPKGGDAPYALDDYKFYVRDETGTNLAVRDEIVALIKDSLGFEQEAEEQAPEQAPTRSRQNGRGRARGKGSQPAAQPSGTAKAQTDGKAAGEEAPLAGDTPTLPADDTTFYLPQIGVEIVESEERNGHQYYTIRDLRNGNIIKNVTRKGARKLWSYAIQQYEDHPVQAAKVQWEGNVALVAAEKRAGKQRYDLALREGDKVRVFYGVTEDGMEGEWARFIQDEA